LYPEPAPALLGPEGGKIQPIFLIVFIVNRTDRYRLEALIELALSYPGSRAASDIAAARDLPAAYLSRLLGDLARAGLVSSRRGPGGGLSLARPPESIPVAEIMASPDPADELPPALARLAESVARAIGRCTSRITLADLARWERQAATIDYSI
jgi:Rrf2 family protein